MAGSLCGFDLRVRDGLRCLPNRMGNLGRGSTPPADSATKTASSEEGAMNLPARRGMSPQARGRELARQGKQLWKDLGSVKLAATELMNQHRDLPSIQAYRYAAGLSQDQAAARYNEVAEHQTSLGGTTINAWETWARGRGAGSPPPFSSLLILAATYGRGPLGVTDEDISPGDLVSEAYERLAPEDQLSLKWSAANRQAPRRADPMIVQFPGTSPSRPTAGGNIVGRDFTLSVPTVDNGNPAIHAFSLPNPHPGQLLDPMPLR